jgi:hypothetical protein
LKKKAIAGPLVGKELERVGSSRTSWKKWRRDHPDTMVLSTDTGYERAYSVDPYEGYYRMGGLMFPVGDVRTDLPPKERVLGVELKDTAKAYPLSVLQKKSQVLKDNIGGNMVNIEISREGDVVEIRDAQGNVIPGIFTYWFAWQAFHPDTEVYSPRAQ